MVGIEREPLAWPPHFPHPGRSLEEHILLPLHKGVQTHFTDLQAQYCRQLDLT